MKSTTPASGDRRTSNKFTAELPASLDIDPQSLLLALNPFIHGHDHVDELKPRHPTPICTESPASLTSTSTTGTLSDMTMDLYRPLD